MARGAELADGKGVLGVHEVGTVVTCRRVTSVGN